MTDLEKLLEATTFTDKTFVERGYESGKVDLPKYLFGGSLYSFTSKVNPDLGMSARQLMTDVDRIKVLFEIYSKLLEVAANMAYSGVTKTDNDLINFIVNKAKLDFSSNKHSVLEMQEWINSLIQRCKNSNDIVNVINNNVKPLELSDDYNILKNEANLLTDYSKLSTPTMEQKVIFDAPPSR